MAQTPPKTLGSRGKRLWREIAAERTLDPMQKVLLEEACRTTDRLEKLDEKLRGDADSWAHLRTRAESLHVDEDGDKSVTIDLVVDGALTEARQQQNILKQLLAAMRLEDVATGKKPQARGGARGAYAPRKDGAASKVVSLAERFGS